MSKSPPSKFRECMSSPPSLSRKLHGSTEMDDTGNTVATVAHFVEQLHANASSAHEKEIITARLLGLARSRKEARSAIGSHSQAMPLLVSALRTGTLVTKANVAATLSALCKEDDLRVKVLLGGCIPPLLILLRSEANDARKAAAEAIYEVSSGGLSDDHVGMKIFVTEGVVPALWEQLNMKFKQDRVVQGFVTGALRNLCGDKDGYWRATLEAGGVDIIVEILASDNAVSQSNAASLLARLTLAFSDSIQKVIDSGAVKALLCLVRREHAISVRASAADALESLTSKSVKAKKAVVDDNGVPVLIGAVVAPSRECMEGNSGDALQLHSMHALANICGGLSELIMYLGKLSQASRLLVPVADIIGALAYSLMVFEISFPGERFNVVEIEGILVMLLKPRDNKHIQDNVLEALSSLYSNPHLSQSLDHTEAKRVLTGLIILVSGETQEGLINTFINLCCDAFGIWEALGKREGIQLLISLLGLSSEQHQEYAVSLLAVLTDQVDDSKWAITAAGGIPPLVQLLEMGSQRACEDAAHILWNMCSYSEDIRACVESADAVPALLWLLKCGSCQGQKASAKALTGLIHSADSATVNQLLALLLGERPSSKRHIISVLGHVLTMASYDDLVQKGTPANNGLSALVQVLNSSNEETQEHAATVIADLFGTRQDICGKLATDEIIHPCIKLLTSKMPVIATQSARALSVLSRPVNVNTSIKMPYIAEGDVNPLIMLAKTSSIDSAETAVAALTNLLSDQKVAGEALVEDVVPALTRALGEGTSSGKRSASRALHQLLIHFPVGEVLRESASYNFTVNALVNSLNFDTDGVSDATDALEVLSLLIKTKPSLNIECSPSAVTAEAISSWGPLIQCLAKGQSPAQDKVIEILSWFCGAQSVILADLLIGEPGCVASLAKRIMNSPCLEVQIGVAALLICVMKAHRRETVDALDQLGVLKQLIYILVDMVKHSGNQDVEVRTHQAFREKSPPYLGGADEFDVPDPAIILCATVALWLLSLISSSCERYRDIIIEVGGIEVLRGKIESYSVNHQVAVVDSEGPWITALLLAILFQDKEVISSHSIIQMIPSLVFLLKSDEVINRYFAAQVLASLVHHGNKAVYLAVASSGAVGGLISLLGNVQADTLNLVALSDEFHLDRNPDQVVLANLFAHEDIRTGPTARKAIPLLVDLLRPMPDRPQAPPVAILLLTQIAEGNDANKLIIAEAGALDALTKYLSLSPQDSTEVVILDLLKILFRNSDVLQYEATFNSLNQLIAVLHLGSKSSRYSAVCALHELLNAEDIRDAEISRQALQPLIDMLNSGSEKEQQAALVALIKLTFGSASRQSAVIDVEGNPLESLHEILSSGSSMELKKNAAQLCYILFDNPKVRSAPVAADFIHPMIVLMKSSSVDVVEASVRAFERLLDDEQHAETASAYDVVGVLVEFVRGSNYLLVEATVSSLIKLGKDRPHCKIDMVKSGIIENALEMLHVVPVSLCSLIVELLRILTNNSGIAKSSVAAKVVEPLFLILLRPDFSMWGQQSALQALVNILEKPQSLTTLKLTPSQIIGTLIPFLESSSQAIQQLGTELLSHLLAQEHFQQDITTKNAVVPLVQLTGIGIPSLQQTAIKALESISITWPQAVADAGGIFELSKVIIQDPQPPPSLWEAAALVLSNVLKFNADYYLKVPPVVLVTMLHSSVDSTLSTALRALIVQEKSDMFSAVPMAEAGAVDALLELMRSHQCEEVAARLLEALFNNVRVREMKVSKYAIAPLSQYLLDPQTQSQPAKLLAALALGDLFQHEGLARASDSVSACRALVSLLEDQPSEEAKIVTVCALQNLVMHSRTNRRAVAEAGGILVIQELLLSQNTEVLGQAALLIKFLFSNHTLQEYVSNELIRHLTAALEREVWAMTTINIEVLRTINVIFINFSKLHISEAATLCIPHLVGALKVGSESAQESVLDTLCLLKQSWSTMPIDIAKAQAMIASEAIPSLQVLMKTCPPSFHEKAESLLHCLPGCLTVTIKRGNNLKQAMGSTNAFCRLTIGNTAPRQTKVVSHNSCPEWKEGFTWAFDVPPKGQKLHILCKSKNTFGKTTLGRVTIQIDKVVNDGVYSGLFSLNHDANRDGSSRTLEIEIVWSNRMTSEDI